MRTALRWGRGTLAGFALIGMTLFMARLAGAQQPVGSLQLQSSRFTVGTGISSSQLNKSGFGFRGVPPMDNFPASLMPSRFGPRSRTAPNGPGVSNSNLFGAFYANPMNAYQPSGFGAPRYDLQPVVNTTTVTPTPAYPTTITALPATPDQFGAPDSATITMGGSPYSGSVSPVGPRVNVPVLNFLSSLAETPAGGAAPSPGPLNPREDLQQIVARSSTLSARDSIRVLGDGAIVVLRGSVVNDYDRQLAEALVRLSPGVQTVRNELTVGP
jgi:hypothetical protein